MRYRALVPGLILGLASALPAGAGWPAGGLLVNGPQNAGLPYPSYQALPGPGGDVIVMGGRFEGMQAYRVLANGTIAAGWPVALPTGAAVANGTGGFYLFHPHLYPDGNWDLYVLQRAGDGLTAGGWPDTGVAVCSAPGVQSSPFACSDGAGGAFVAWVDARSGGQADLYVHHLLPSGAMDPAHPDGERVATLSGSLDPWARGIVPDGAGGIFLAWQEFGADLELARLDPSLVPLWARTFPDPNHYQRYPRLLPDPAGGLYLAFQQWTGADFDVFVMRLDEGGAPVAGWPAAGVALGAAGVADQRPVLASDGAGGVFVGWNSAWPEPFRVQHLTPGGAGAPGWPPTGVSLATVTANSEAGQMDVAPDGLGGVIACFAAGERYGAITYPHGLRAQRLTASGGLASGWIPGGEVVALSANGYVIAQPILAALHGGGTVAMWFDRYSIMTGSNLDREWAQRLDAYVPTPVLVSTVSVEVSARSVRLSWWLGGSAPGAATVYRRAAGGDWATLATLEPRGGTIVTYEDRAVTPGSAYEYRLGVASEGGEALSEATSVLVPAGEALTLSLAPRPNPSTGAFEAAFVLPTAEPARLEVMDVTGRRVADFAIRGEAGPHRVLVGAAHPLAPGLYFATLTQGSRRTTARASVIR